MQAELKRNEITKETCFVPATHLGVTRFGQSGDLDSVYRHHGLDVDSIVGAALDLVD